MKIRTLFSDEYSQSRVHPNAPPIHQQINNYLIADRFNQKKKTNKQQNSTFEFDLPSKSKTSSSIQRTKSGKKKAKKNKEKKDRITEMLEGKKARD